MARLTLAFMVLLGLLVGGAGRAYAHPILDEAQGLFDEADFEGSLAAFARAEQAGDLTREDLTDLYVHRALVHHTLGNDDDETTDLMRLASLEPDYEFGRQFPPVMREAFERAKQQTTGRIAVRIEVSQRPGGVRLEAHVENDTNGIVRELRIGARAPGNAWTQRTNAPLEMPAPSDSTLQIYAEAVGPGGAVVASDGTPGEPIEGVVSELQSRQLGVESDPDVLDPETPRDDDGVPLWPFLVGGGVLVAAGAAILLAILLTSGSDNTALMPPMVQP